MSRARRPDEADHDAPDAPEPDAPPAGKKSLTALLPPPVPPKDSALFANHVGLAGRGPDEPVPPRIPPPPVKAERERDVAPVAAAAGAAAVPVADDPFALHLPAELPAKPPAKPRVERGGPVESEEVVEDD